MYYLIHFLWIIRCLKINAPLAELSNVQLHSSNIEALWSRYLESQGQYRTPLVGSFQDEPSTIICRLSIVSAYLTWRYTYIVHILCSRVRKQKKRSAKGKQISLQLSRVLRNLNHHHAYTYRIVSLFCICTTDGLVSVRISRALVQFDIWTTDDAPPRGHRQSRQENSLFHFQGYAMSCASTQLQSSTGVLQYL